MSRRQGVLELLLRLRRLERDRRAAALRVASSERQAREGDLSRRNAGREAADARLAARAAQGVDVSWWRAANQAVAGLVAATRLAREEFDAARESEARARDGSVEAERRVESLEQLAEEQEREAQRQQRRREQKALDDRPRARGGRVPWVRALAGAALLFGALQPHPVAAAGAEAPSVERLLSELRARLAELDRREASLEERERALEILDRTVAERIAELEAIADRIDERLVSWEDAQGAKSISKLAKMYGAMPPPQAAALIEGLEIDLATRILEKMKPRDSGALLPLLSADRALSISRRVSHPLGVPPASLDVGKGP